MKAILLVISLFFALVSTAQVSTEQRHLYSDSVYWFKNNQGVLQKDVLEVKNLGLADDSATILDIYDTTTDHHFVIKIDSAVSVYKRHLDGYSKPFYMYSYHAEMAGQGPITFMVMFYPDPTKLIHSICFGTLTNYVNFKFKYTPEELKAGKLLPTKKSKR